MSEDKKQITEEFIEMVKSWVKIDDEIREHQHKIKELKNEKKDYEEFVLEYMNKIGENCISITGGKLRQTKTKTRSGLKQDMIQSAIYDLTKDSTKSMQMTKYIMEKRTITERVNLKRTINKKKKN